MHVLLCDMATCCIKLTSITSCYTNEPIVQVRHTIMFEFTSSFVTDCFVLEPHQSRVFRGWPAAGRASWLCGRSTFGSAIALHVVIAPVHFVPLRSHRQEMRPLFSVRDLLYMYPSQTILGFPLVFCNISIFIVYFVQHIRAIKITSISQLLYLQAIFEANELIFLSVFYLKAPKAESLLHNFFGLS